MPGPWAGGTSDHFGLLLLSLFLLSLLAGHYAWTMGRSYFWWLHVPISHLTHLFHVLIWIFSQKLLSGNEEPSRDFSRQGFQRLFLSCLSFSKLLGGYFFTINFWLLLLLLLMLFLCYQFLRTSGWLFFHHNIFSWIVSSESIFMDHIHIDRIRASLSLWSQVQDTCHWEMAFGILWRRLSSHKVGLLLWQHTKMQPNSTGGALTPFLGCYNSQLTTGKFTFFIYLVSLFHIFSFSYCY